VTALDALASRQREARLLFEPEKLARAEAAIGAITRELEARRLSVRDALIAQQALVDMLQAGLEAKLRLCLASVEAARAAGLPLEGIQ
jgi:cobalt-zinc-cadmium efflux system outer membrane protein